MGRCRCVPTTKTIAAKLDMPKGEVEREVEKLLNLRWARKYKEGSKSLFVLGSDAKLFMTLQVGKKFRKAKRKVDGGVQLTEWRWVPLDRWRGITLWQMIRDKFWERGQEAAFAKAKGFSQMQKLIVDVGIRKAKDVADFFVQQYPALKVHFKWIGIPNPGLFKGFFHSIAEIKERGMPQKGAVHNRGNSSSMAEELVEEQWVEFE
jgi:hypothetical protein